ncbi:MAG: MFS transporter [Dehalococcoidia bacterium]|nr:MFS transporter [Dehalococcoidia bacterium]
MLPEVKAAFGLGALEVGGIAALREVLSGLITLPGGIIADVLRRYWGLVLAVCMAGFGLGWLVMGAAPVYGVLLLGMALVSVSTSLWHLPAMASLSHHFSHRRGTALSFHGIGGNIGDVAGPAITGFLLLVLAWREVLSIYAVAPILLAFVVFWAFRDIGKTADADTPLTDLAGQVRLTRQLLRDPALWGVILVAGLRGMASLAFFTFLTLYLDEEAGLGKGARGLYFGLLVAVGVVSTPTMGYLSDRLGRKLVLVPGLLLLCILSLLMVPFGDGFTLPIIIAALGLFLFSDQPILTAAALDMVDEGVATSTLGVLSFSRFVMSGASPLIAGAMRDAWGFDAIFYYAAVLFALAAVVLTMVPLRKRAGSPAAHGHAH